MPHINKQMISFFLTTKCNLRCGYCYNSQERNSHEERSLSFDFAKAGIDNFFFSHHSRHIRFYGPGEPTQEFSLLKRIREYAYSIAGKRLCVEIQTNGAFSKNIAEWISQNINIIWVSLDGPPDIQDFNRPFPDQVPSSPVIERNIRHMITCMRNTANMVGVRITVSDKNIDRQIEMVDYFRNLGISYIWTDPLFLSVDNIPVCRSQKKMQEFSFDMRKYIDNYVEAYHYAKEKGVFYGSFLMCNFDGISKYHCRACTPVPHLTPDGYISACDMVVFGESAHHMSDLIFGKWNAKKGLIEFDNEKIRILQSRSVDNILGCKGCEVSEHCGGYCLGEVLNETGDLFGKKNTNCIAIKELAKRIGFFEKPFDYLHP